MAWSVALETLFKSLCNRFVWKKRDRSPCIWTRLDDRTPDFCSTFFLCSESFLNGVHPSAGLRSLIWAKFMPAAILISKVIVKRLAIAAKTAPWTMWRVWVFSSYMCKSLQMVWAQTKTVAASTLSPTSSLLFCMGIEQIRQVLNNVVLWYIIAIIENYKCLPRSQKVRWYRYHVVFSLQRNYRVASCGSCLFESHEVLTCRWRSRWDTGREKPCQWRKKAKIHLSWVLTSCFIPDFDGTESVLIQRCFVTSSRFERFMCRRSHFC